MELILIFIAACLLAGGLAALFAYNPQWLPEKDDHHQWENYWDSTPQSSDKQKKLNRFSLQKTLLIIGPSANHPACRMQRRLLKPTVPLLIREDISIMELYGDNMPRKNGEVLSWLDPSLLRHALDAEDGFLVIYVDDTGKTVFRKKSPMLTEMITERARLQIITPPPVSTSSQSDIIRRLKAA